MLCTFLWLAWLLPPAFALSSEQAAPRIAHPPNQVHLDKRFGVAVEPGLELFTGDVIVLTVEDAAVYDSESVFRVWGLDRLGQITCQDPAVEAAALGANYNGGTGADWSPSLANMFVVSVISGRLGELSLSPVVAFPNSPKYITPQPLSPRSGVVHDIGGAGWEAGDDVLRVASFIPLADPMYAYGTHFKYLEDGTQYGYTDAPAHDYGFTSYSKGYSGSSASYSSSSSSSSTSEYDSGRLAIRGSSFHDFCRCDPTTGYVKCRHLGVETMMYPTPEVVGTAWSWFKVTKIPHTVVRRMLENYQAAVSNGLPRSFLLFSSLPFTDRIDAVHYHGAEAQLSVRNAT